MKGDKKDKRETYLAILITIITVSLVGTCGYFGTTEYGSAVCICLYTYASMKS